MRSQKFESLLACILRFSQMEDERQICESFDSLIHQCQDCGFFYNPRVFWSGRDQKTGELTYDYVSEAFAVQEDLIDTIGFHMTGDPSGARYRTADYIDYYKCETDQGTVDYFRMAFEPDHHSDVTSDYWVMSSIMIHIMFFLGIKIIKQCPGCHQFFAAARKNKNYCNANCRQKAYTARLPIEDRQKQWRERSKTHYDKHKKKGGGDGS